VITFDEILNTMKRIYLLLIAVVVATTAYSQKLSKEEMEAKIDSLTKANSALVANVDTLGKQLLALQAIYDTLKVGYIKSDFTANTISAKMDDLMNSNDGIVDSLTTENEKLKSKVEELTTGAVAVQKEKEQVIHDLEAAKRLLDQGILTEDEFQSIKKKYISKL
jgi:outer membrane murein-binding lipoprotein Lpp